MVHNTACKVMTSCDHMKPEEQCRKLTSGKPKQWEAVFKAVIKPECGGLCVLECERCKANVNHTNPSQAAQRHKFIAAALAATGVRSSPRNTARWAVRHPDFPAALKKHAVSA